MKNILEYVLRDEKIKEGYVEITGPYPAETITYDEVYRTWLEEKKLWDKDSGRMYAHNLISFHKDEKVTPAEVLEIGKEFVEKFFPDHQCVMGVHQDKDHLHCHIVTNSVSYIDGKKLHQTKRDLERQKEFTNTLCFNRGLTIAEKGRHFDGTAIEQFEVTAWSKDKYNLLLNKTKKSYVADCAIALVEVVPKSCSRNEFIMGMEEKGWSVQWEESRKHLVFQNDKGDKVRDSNIEKTFAGMKVNKEDLTSEFNRQNELKLAKLRAKRKRAAELKQYYTELESVTAGLDNAKAIRDDSEIANGIERELSRTGISEESGQTLGYRKDTEAFIRELDSNEKASGEKRNRRISERQNRDTEQRRLSAERERAFKTKEQRIAADRIDLQRLGINV
jgi:hypothetical protein